MSFDSILGQSLDGKQLQTLSPNSTTDQLVTALNAIINKLNNNSQELVASGTVEVPVSTSPQSITTIPHNLGYHPRALVFLNNVKITIDSDHIYPEIDIPLPTYLKSGTVGVGGSGTPSTFFQQWMDYFVDSTNLYVHTLNPDPTFSITLPVTYLLFRNPVS